MIEYNEFFADLVQGHLGVEFDLVEGHPQFEERENLRHYRITISLKTPNRDVTNVVYRLDPSYYNPVRESKDQDNDFKIHTTTFGDYYFDVDVQVGTQIVRQRALLSDLLKEAHGQSDNPEIKEALQYILEH